MNFIFGGKFLPVSALRCFTPCWEKLDQPAASCPFRPTGVNTVMSFRLSNLILARRWQRCSPLTFPSLKSSNQLKLLEQKQNPFEILTYLLMLVPLSGSVSEFLQLVFYCGSLLRTCDVSACQWNQYFWNYSNLKWQNNHNHYSYKYGLAFEYLFFPLRLTALKLSMFKHPSIHIKHYFCKGHEPLGSVSTL